MPPPHYDAVLCDIDGVLRHWPAADAIERAQGLPAGALAAAAHYRESEDLRRVLAPLLGTPTPDRP
ncbi:hypothetical protein [Streptomyces montanus]|uniref:hypothetical protein n=1 Tax=Streptomyces montanus TaxID=2580423 RepID=UPI001BB117C6|nr:hypothetical protein [Streptomyces montanus]